ncbi:sortase [Candidatus Nomurabacteria bacterium]|nr:sortase [Candidatus Nomurabacteria bacterium]
MNNIFEIIWAKKLAFLGTFFLVFTVSYIVLLAVDFLPEPPATEESVVEEESEPVEIVAETPIEEIEEVEVAVENMEPVFPVKINIEKIGKTIPVLNPSSRTIADLDAALLDGVVRHPDSATLTQEGNVFILGHSSYLPKVFNKNFQAFNGIQDLAWGDIIEVYSEDKIYEYRVEKVYRASAQDVTVPIAGNGYHLTLATCNSFGSVDDRYIVEAKQIDIKEL